MKFLVDFCLDGYNTDQEVQEACIAFMEQELDISSSSLKVTPIEMEGTQVSKEGILKLLFMGESLSDSPASYILNVLQFCLTNLPQDKDTKEIEEKIKNLKGAFGATFDSIYHKS